MDIIEQLADLFDEHDGLYGASFISLASVLAAVVAAYFFFQNFIRDEAPIPISLALPEEAKAGWKGEDLTKPSLKVICKRFINSLD